MFIPYNPVMESPRGFTVEAWVYLNDYSRYELSGIAMRWTPVPNEQSWLLGVVGAKLGPPTITTSSPGWFNQEVATFNTGHILFAFRPELAAGTQSFSSTAIVPKQRWVHVAASVDGEVVRIFIDGRLDVQVAIANGIHRSSAPLVVGNALDPRLLTEFGSDLRQDPANLPLPFYALERHGGRAAPVERGTALVRERGPEVGGGAARPYTALPIRTHPAHGASDRHSGTLARSTLPGTRPSHGIHARIRQHTRRPPPRRARVGGQPRP